MCKWNLQILAVNFSYIFPLFPYLPPSPALSQGLVSMDTVKDAVSRLFMVRMKLGEFDPPEMNPYTKSVITKNWVV